MSTFRTAFGLVVCVLLCLGYAASQVAYFRGTFETYAERVDVPQVRYLCLAIFVLGLILAGLRQTPNAAEEHGA